jgi:hypothetical protein
MPGVQIFKSIKHIYIYGIATLKHVRKWELGYIRMQEPIINL